MRRRSEVTRTTKWSSVMNMRYRSKYGKNCRGFGTLGRILAIPVAIIVLLALAVGSFEGHKAYWDSRVREMCEKDGGVAVYEKTRISLEQFNRSPKVIGYIGIESIESAKPEDVVFSIDSETVLRDWNPRVTRFERVVKRRMDGKVVGKIVSYSRIGGDFPTGIVHESSFTCTEYKKIYQDESQFFVVEEKTK